MCRHVLIVESFESFTHVWERGGAWQGMYCTGVNILCSLYSYVRMQTITSHLSGLERDMQKIYLFTCHFNLKHQHTLFFTQCTIQVFQAELLLLMIQ